MRKTILFSFAFVSLLGVALASPMPVGPRFEAASSKKGRYITEGFFSGGQRSITSVKLKAIRRGARPVGYERVVLDLEPVTEDTVTIPYFEVKPAMSENRIIVSIWADVQYDFDAAQVRKVFAKSKNIRKVTVLPHVEDGLTMIELQLQPKSKAKSRGVESFQLANPSRIILDLRT